MAIWRVLEMALLLIVFVTIFTQVVIPGFTRKPFFWFSKSRKKSEETTKNKQAATDN